MRNKIVYISIISTAVLSAFTFIAGSMWTVNDKGVKITFDVPADPHQLSFTAIHTTLNFDAGDLLHSELIARIDVKSLQTEDPGLTKHLLSADFLEADKFPEIKFISTRIEKAEAGYTARGALAMKDSVHAISIPFTFDQKGEEGVFKGSFSIFSGDYGVMKKSKSGSDKVIISLEIPVSRTKGQ